MMGECDWAYIVLGIFYVEGINDRTFVLIIFVFLFTDIVVTMTLWYQTHYGSMLI